MKILVCISCVPDTTSKINFTADRSAFDKTGIQWIINPLDEYALTKAVQFQKSFGAQVTVVSVGGVSVEPVLRKALAMGADDAARIDAEAEDSFQTAKELADFAENANFDLIFCGKESLDYNGEATPAMLAALLNLPFINSCIGLELSGNEIVATREANGGKETLKAGLPAVIAAQKGFVEEKDLIIPNMRGIMTARTKPLTVKEAAAKPATETVSFENAPPRSAVKLVPPDNLDELVRLLHEDAKVI